MEKITKMLMHNFKSGRTRKGIFKDRCNVRFDPGWLDVALLVKELISVRAWHKLPARNMYDKLTFTKTDSILYCSTRI